MSLFSPSRQTALAALFIFGFSAHLIAEAVRRFFLYSNSTYLIADIVLVGAACCSVAISSIRIDRSVGVLLFCYVMWGIFSLLVNEGSSLLLLVGVRPIILALAGFVLAEIMFRVHSKPDGVFFNTCGAWTLVILAVAIAQIFAGVDAAINQLPADAGVEGGGRGDYGANGVFLEWLFRPTSIFMHTGRLGQFAFFLSVVACLRLFMTEKASFTPRVYALLAIVLVIVSGQRAAGVFLLISCALGIAKFGSREILVRSISIMVVVLVAATFVPGDARDVILGRFASGFTGGIDRAVETTQYWETGLWKFPVFGMGLGFFSFGALPFGGAIYYEYMPRFGGGGENSWLRVQGEVGFPGFVMFLGVITMIVLKSYRRAFTDNNTEARVIHLASLMFALSTGIWALTHDVFGNYLHLFGLFVLFGASCGLASRRYGDISLSGAE